jgi:hypothetical protein
MFRRAAVAHGPTTAERDEAPTVRADAQTTRAAAPATAAPATRTRAAAPGTRRARVRRAPRDVAAGTTAAVGAGMLALSRLIRLVAAVLALVIAAGIALIALDAHSTNSVVSTVHDAARSLVGPFDGMFSASGHKLTIAINWGIALVVYLVVGSVLASLVARLGSGAATAYPGKRPMISA